MTRRKGAPATSWGSAPVCVCGAGLIWPLYIPAPERLDPAERRKRLPLDATPTEDPAARFAVFGAGRTCRRLDADEPLDLNERRHEIHFATCPVQVTADQLASMPQQNGRPR